jgi:hypothetical protein
MFDLSTLFNSSITLRLNGLILCLVSTVFIQKLEALLNEWITRLKLPSDTHPTQFLSNPNSTLPILLGLIYFSVIQLPQLLETHPTQFFVHSITFPLINDVLSFIISREYLHEMNRPGARDKIGLVLRYDLAPSDNLN